MKNKLLLLVTAGLIIRLIMAFLPGFKIDVDAWFAWAVRLNEVGFANFYSDSTWTNYTPGFLYILGVLGFLKKMLLINDRLFFLLLKIPAILAEIFLGIFIYQKILKKSGWATVAFTMILFTPVFIFNSSVWGQIDGLLSLMLVLSVYFLIQKKLILSSVFWGLAFLIKPQATAILPVLALFLIKNLSIRNFLKVTIPASLTILLLSLPFFVNKPLGIINLFTKMVSDYPYTSLFAYNLWGIVGFWIKDERLWNNLSYQNWGYILVGGYLIILSYLYLKKRLTLYAVGALATLAFFFLPTRVHERYLYPALVFLVITATQLKSKILVMLTAILSLLHLLNLYQVYVYYNEIYSNVPKTLYNHFVYNFVNENGKTLSTISLAIFIIISVIIFKSYASFEKD
ncbi:hypothetical protein HYS95_00655 [Candidatus Daviesbacteria bacterium]|nr:hypothetical protein [Candidatus Daviesbacteria bacterium]